VDHQSVRALGARTPIALGNGTRLLGPLILPAQPHMGTYVVNALRVSVMMAVGILAIVSDPAYAADSAGTSFLNHAIIHPAPLLEIKFGCKFVQDKLVCGNDVGDANNDGGDKKESEGQGTQGERSCPPGYVVLDKPNKYGAFCEPKEGSPAPAPAEGETCKFPGQVGTPPNCKCPVGTEFLGYKGCVKFTTETFQNDLDPTDVKAFQGKCQNQYHGTPVCHIYELAKPEIWQCRCIYRAYLP